MADENKDQKTAVAASDTATKEAPTANADSDSVNKDAKSESSTEEKPLPFDKDPRWKSARLAEQKLEQIMKANEVDDVDELIDLISSGKKVSGKAVDLDNLDDIIKKAATLDKYEEHWRRQKELERKNVETPEQTIARLEKEKESLAQEFNKKEKTEVESREAKRAVEFYEGEVQSTVESIEELPKEAKEILKWSLGVGNDCNDISITDKKQIKRVVNNGTKKMEQFVKAIKEEAVKEYLAGKTAIPKVPSTDGTATTTTPPKLTGLRNLRNAFAESLMKKSGG